MSGDEWTEQTCLWNKFNMKLSDDAVGGFLNYYHAWKFPHIAHTWMASVQYERVGGFLDLRL